jgi:hypothetical protein
MLEMTVLPFVMQEGLVITANFVPNPFGDHSGDFFGNAVPSNSSVSSTHATEGGFRASVAGNGGFTAKLRLNSVTHSLSGVFGVDGKARFGPGRSQTLQLTRRGLPPLVLSLQITLAAGVEPEVTGSIAVDGAPFVSIASGRAQLSPDAMMGYSASGALRTKSLSSLAIGLTDLATQPPQYNVADLPQGWGPANMTLTSKGSASLVGHLPDGRSFSGASTLVTRYSGTEASFIIPLFVDVAGGGGLNLEINMGNPVTPNGSVWRSRWNKPVRMGDSYYPAGWPESLALQVLVGPYFVDEGRSMLDNPTSPGNTINVSLKLNGNALQSPLEGHATVTNKDIATPLPGDPVALNLRIQRNNGLFTGSFLSPNGLRPVFRGIVLRSSIEGEPVVGLGHILFPSTPTLSGSSGRVLIKVE